jgi:hypothetical protein
MLSRRGFLIGAGSLLTAAFINEVAELRQFGVERPQRGPSSEMAVWPVLKRIGNADAAAAGSEAA